MKSHATRVKNAYSNKPSLVFGMGLVVLSYVVCWPVISALGAFSLYLDRPYLFKFGGPGIYIFSYILLFIGLSLAGKEAASLMRRQAVDFASRTIRMKMQGR